MPTLRDIANELGVSESTISRVLNGKGRVSEETREKVLAYAGKIHYLPNQMAQALKMQRVNSLGVVVPDISNEFYALLFKSIDRLVSHAGYTPILFNIGEDAAREEAFVTHLRSSTVGGLVVATAGADVYSSLPESLLQQIVFVDNLPKGDFGCNFVGADNVGSSYSLTQHLIDRGHRRIATVVGPAGESSARERLDGFEGCLVANGLALNPEWIVRTNFQYADGYAKVGAIMEGDDRPTAVIAQNNVLAYATVRMARQRGMTVPRDLAVACFDHIDTYGFMRPVITTMVQRVDQIAEKAWELLQDGMDGHYSGETHLFDAEFHLGETT
ncbi:LacI family DNA-binding transcriptional regulator [Tessaracoccus lubricantis]|uniref:LacI family DNA-binding transcriptional regulator n=1 Tax=Tessaracoccus lubricantis TaxID=545543 RepID=A0ABP9FL30_9ACTN